MSRHLSFILSVTLVTAALAGPLEARPRPFGRDRSDVVTEWGQRLMVIDEALREGKWSRARRNVDFLLSEMTARIESGDGSAPLLAMASLLRAVASAGLGELNDAAWDFSISQTLHPGFSEVDLSAFGALAAHFDEWRLEPDEGWSMPQRDETATTPANITPPVRVRSEPPKYPSAKRNACIDGPIIVRALVTAEGVPHTPRLQTEQDPVLSYVALDALRHWRFRPALLDGEPVAFYYNLTVNFNLPACTNPAAVSRRSTP